MRQTFDESTDPSFGPRHVPLIRAAMAAQGLDGFLVPHEDEHQNEYLPAANDRLAWASGFTGSAGAGVILKDRAAIFVDGRYTLQVREQVDTEVFEIRDLIEGGVPAYLETAGKGAVIGYDPRLHSPAALEGLKAAAARAGATLTAVASNPLDEAWGQARPAQPMAPVTPHPIEYAGEKSSAKRARVGAAVAALGAEAAVITAPASIAWLFNIRGGDVIRSPLPLAQAILNADGTARLFLEPAKVTSDLPAWLGNQVALETPDRLAEALGELSDKSVAIDPAQSSAWYFDALAAAGAKVVRTMDPCTLPRACKNAVELDGTREAHRRDGAANGHGALPHYRPTERSNERARMGSLLLVDSGGQYLDGTTDVTRTVAIGQPTTEMVQRNTLVLKGHLAIARLRFPSGTTGSAIDALARMALWAHGLDYDHGTGHGVGVYLGVHEGPQRISKAPNTIALQPGMIVSNEPGYYKDGEYGIRIENLEVVMPAEDVPGGDRPMHRFEALTLAPIDRRLVDKSLLTPEEVAQFDAYHSRVLREIGPRLEPEVRIWLQEACAPL